MVLINVKSQIAERDAEIESLRSRLREAEAARDSWERAHQELVDVRAADLQAMAAKMEGVQDKADIDVVKWIARAELQRKRAEKAEAACGGMRAALEALIEIDDGLRTGIDADASVSVAWKLLASTTLGADVAAVIGAARELDADSSLQSVAGWYESITKLRSALAWLDGKEG